MSSSVSVARPKSPILFVSPTAIEFISLIFSNLLLETRGSFEDVKETLSEPSIAGLSGSD